MSHSYCLICAETGDVLDLGKIVNVNRSGQSIPWQFGGWHDVLTNEWVEGDALLRLIERFLIMTRGKELRLIPTSLLEKVDIERLQFFDSAKELLEKEIDPIPDDSDDASAVPTSFVQYLSDVLCKN